MSVYRFYLQKHLSTILVYAAVIAATFFVASSRLQLATNEPTEFITTTDAPVETKPFFSLSTNRTYGTSENPRLWLDHRGIDSLDFRVYRINDPRQFFTQLSNPHQMGEDESEQVATDLSAKRSLLERIRGVKVWAYSGIRNYFQGATQTEHAQDFQSKVSRY